MTTETTVQAKDKTFIYKTVLTRKVRRQMLKDSIGSNKIAKLWRDRK